MVTVAKSHPLLKDGPLKKVDFQVTNKLNRLDNKVSGKGKKGGQFLQADAPLCIITGDSGVKYTLSRFVLYNSHVLNKVDRFIQADASLCIIAGESGFKYALCRFVLYIYITCKYQ